MARRAKRTTTGGAAGQPAEAGRTGPPASRTATLAWSLGACFLLLALTLVTFWPVTSNGFVNWDDPSVLVDNTSLRTPGVAAWAFTTTHMGHYQPLSWLAWALLGGTPPDPSRIHRLSVAVHAFNAALVALLCGLWLRWRPTAAPPRVVWLAATIAAATFAVHPLRVEPVAWASAFPYVLSYAWLLVSAAAWMTWRRTTRRGWWLASVGCFALSQLARVTVPLWPVVLALAGLLDRHARERTIRQQAVDLAPFAAIALGVGAAEWQARSVEELAAVGAVSRLTFLLSNPGLYLWRTVLPFGLTPLDPLPLHEVVRWGNVATGLAVFAAAVGLTWRVVSPQVAGVVWGAYVLLLLPVIGLTPSGLQATADRYTYGPGILLAVGLAAALAPSVRTRPWVAGGVGLAVILALATVTREYTAYWRDSVSLWTRAVELDPRNDVALYNLALARLDLGRRDEAIATFEQLVALVPDHDVGRRQLERLRSDRDQADGDAHANAGRLREAIAVYDRVLAREPTRIRARANRGMALASIGDLRRARDDLRAAIDGGIDDPPLFNALSFALATEGRTADAISTLEAAVTRHPSDIGLAGNLARLLVTAAEPGLRQPARALAIAQQASARAQGQDPRLLDTLALALAANGQPDAARTVLVRAIDLARRAGDDALAAELDSRRLPSPGQ